jgi:hypothetical protein
MALDMSYASVTRSTWGADEYSIINNTTTIAASSDAGMYQLWVDFSALVAGDAYDIFLNEKAKSGGTQRKELIGTALLGSGLWKSPALMLGHGWDFSIKKRSGSDQSLDITIRRAS